MTEKIIRIFPFRNNCTPSGDLIFAGDKRKGLTADPPFPALIPDAKLAHVSVTFTWDIPEGERLHKAWQQYLPTRIGGPAFDDVGGEFQPGRYLKNGITITTRGCPRSCWFCYVPFREGKLRCLKIRPGHILQDNNIFAAPKKHQRAVYKMLRDQRRRVTFAGGLDARLLRDWIVDEIQDIPIDQIFFAYDEPEQIDALRKARVMFKHLNQRQMRCYVLVGFRHDDPELALLRLEMAWEMGYMPFAMYFRGADNAPPNGEWSSLVREWSRPAIMVSNHND